MTENHNFRDVMSAATALRDAMGKRNHERSLNDVSDAFYDAQRVVEEQQDRLYNELAALSKPDRDIFVAMYEMLRHWAYNGDVGL